jgi:HD-GYP domain-containing protein (c-di-GMP phosphodiesterase class II)
MVVPEPSDGLTGMAWFAAYAVGSSIEYLICAVIAYYITKTARETLEKQYNQDEKIRTMQSQLISGFANLIESKDPTTGEHVKRTSKYVEMICKKLRELGYYKNELTDEQIAYMIKAAPLHDIGKMEVPDAILTKPGKLTKEEFAKIQQHTIIGEKFIDTNFTNIEDPGYTQIAEIMALCHHEWWNGNGYPFHLIGEEIPLAARIMAAADVLDALLTIRQYKNAIPLDDTIVIMESLSGSQFDPAIVEAVFNLRDEIEKYLNK